MLEYLVWRGGELPPFDCALRYVLAGNGLFLQAQRAHIWALVPLAVCQVKGLPPLEPYLTKDLPRIEPELVGRMLENARNHRDSAGNPLEIVFHFLVRDNDWELVIPEQEQGQTFCRPVGSGEESYRQALLEIHSHHRLPAYFSAADDRDEQGVFRFLGVIGNLFQKPVIRLRLGIYGHFIPLPAGFLLEGSGFEKRGTEAWESELPMGNAVTKDRWRFDRQGQTGRFISHWKRQDAQGKEGGGESEI